MGDPDSLRAGGTHGRGVNHSLESARAWLQATLTPRAQALDTQTEALSEALAALGREGLLGVRVPATHEGAEWSDTDLLAWQQACARSSGALAFLQAQHHSACAVVAASQDPAVKARWLPTLARGERTSGIAFSHLRRSEPALTARRVDGGWRLDGKAPWVTGHRLFTHCTTAAALSDQSGTLFVLHPFRADQGLTVGPVLALAALTAANTVTLTYADYFVPDDQVLALAPADWISAKDRQAVASQGMLALGCAWAAVDHLGDQPAANLLAAQLQHLETELLALVGCGERYADALTVRSRVIVAMGRCAHAAVVAAAGSANLAGHPTQRIWREALVFTVLSQTPDVRAATLDALTR